MQGWSLFTRQHKRMFCSFLILALYVSVDLGRKILVPYWVGWCGFTMWLWQKEFQRITYFVLLDLCHVYFSNIHNWNYSYLKSWMKRKKTRLNETKQNGTKWVFFPLQLVGKVCKSFLIWSGHFWSYFHDISSYFKASMTPLPYLYLCGIRRNYFCS